jgi:predicted lipoprotein with Yx(FWY)xxD motif
VTRMARRAVAAGAVAAGAVVLVLLLTRSSPSESRRPNKVDLAERAALRIARTKLGPILVNGQGHTLYLFLKDRRGNSACYDACARIWPPAIVAGTPSVGRGVASAKVTTTRRKDHRRQLVYNGHPLYAMTADTRPGETQGQGFLGTWFVVSPAGNKIGEAKTSTPGY